MTTGILNQAASAKQQTEEQSELEQVKLAVTASMMNENHKIDKEQLDEELANYGLPPVEGDETNGYTLAGKYNNYTIESDGTVIAQGGNGENVTIADLISSGQAVSTNTTLEDENGDSITIPQGFNLSSESPELVTQGMIIEDSEDNQYVWIPVFEKSDSRTWGADYSAVADTTEGTEKYYDEIEEALINTTNGYTKDYRKSSYTDVWYGDENYGQRGYYNGTEFIYYTNGNMTETEYNTLYHNMLKSVYKNDGFYIARYEMGKEVVADTTQAQNATRTGMNEYTASDATNTSTTVVENGAPSIEGMSKPVSKANAVAYNYITQSQAQMLAESLNYSGVTSSLMFGVQWDAVCVFIEHYDTRNTQGSDWLKNNTYSKEWGNYNNSSFTMDRGFYSTTYSSNPVKWNDKSTEAKGTSTSWMCTTGASDQNSSLNIYDFGGNLYEWTLERSSVSSTPCVYRGGGFFYSYYACDRSNIISTYGSDYLYSARPSLFM